MGHYTTQGFIIPPEGISPASLQRLSDEVEAKAMRRWMRRKLAVLEGQVGSLTSVREHLEDQEVNLHRRVAELEGQIEIGRREKVQLKAALAVSQEKLQAAHSSEAQEQALLRLKDELAEERKIVSELRAELTSIQSSPANKPFGGQSSPASTAASTRGKWEPIDRTYVGMLVGFAIIYFIHFYYTYFEIYYTHLYIITAPGGDAAYKSLRNSFTEKRIIMSFALFLAGLALIVVRIYQSRLLYWLRKLLASSLMAIGILLLVVFQVGTSWGLAHNSPSDFLISGGLLAWGVAFVALAARLLSRGLKRAPIAQAAG